MPAPVIARAAQRVSGAPQTRDLAAGEGARGKTPNQRRTTVMLRRIRGDGCRV